jgi:hypothetical protein
MPSFLSHLLLAVVLSGGSLYAQTIGTAELPPAVRTADFTLSISDVQTTTLIFPYDVVSVDRGTPDVLTQTLEEVLNVVKVKAADDQLDLTSLTVITRGGMVYTFRVRYDRYPTTLTYNLAELSTASTAPPASTAVPAVWTGPSSLLGLWYATSLLDGSLPQGAAAEPPDTAADPSPNPMGLVYRRSGVAASQMELVSRKLAAAGTSPHHSRVDRAVGSRLDLEGIWIGGDILYFRFTLHNASQIAYDLDFWRFYLVDAKKAKRTAIQEREVEILNVYADGPGERVEADQAVTYVVAMKKFTIPDRKNLVLELFERGGGRHHELKLQNRHIVTAQLIAGTPY